MSAKKMRKENGTALILGEDIKCGCDLRDLG